MALIHLTLAWSLGILAARTWGLPWPWWALLFAAGLGATRALPLPWRRAGCLLILALCAGAGRYFLSQPRWGAHTLAAYNDRGAAVTVWGYVSAEPEVRGAYAQTEVTIQWVDLGAGPNAVRGKALVHLPLYPSYTYGDRLQLTGHLETPPILDTFSYREYLAARGIHSLLRQARAVPLPGRAGNPLLWGLARVRRALRGVIETALPQPEAGLLAGILLGMEHTLPADVLEAFRLAGLTHLIVISGFNVSLVAQAVMYLSRRWAHRWLALWASMGAIGLFVFLVGPSAPVMRAAWMGGLALLAQRVGRRSHGLTSLAAATWAMTLVNPLLLWSVSFQLSFAATLALLLLEPAISRRLYAWVAESPAGAAKGLLFLGDVLLATLAAQIATLPLLWAHFGQVSILALPANLLVLPWQPFIMALGAATLGAGLLWAPAGHMAGWLVWPFLHVTLRVAEWCGRIPWAGFTLPRLPWPLVWALYGGVFLWVLKAPRKVPHLPSRPTVPRRAWWGALALLLVLPVAVDTLATLPDGRLHLYVLDVGQGDALLLRTPRGRTLLIDGGPDPLLLRARLGRVLPFWERHIDLLIATHADSDHLTGLIEALEHYRVGAVLQGPLGHGNALSEAWYRALAAKGLKPQTIARGTRLTIDEGLAMEVLHPPAHGAPSVTQSDNAQSVALRVSFGQCRMLLTADAEADAERDWLAQGLTLQAAVLKVSHHGARGATSAEFLSAVNPQIALVSVGAENRFGHPSEEVLQRLEAIGAQVWRTDAQGTIEVITDGRRLWVKVHPTRR